MGEYHLYNGDVAAYVDGTLSTEDRAGIESHLAVCDVCTEEVAAVYRAVHSSPSTRSKMPHLTAAAVIAAIVAGIWFISPASKDLGGAGEPVFRADQQTMASELEVLNPADGSDALIDSVAFKWESAGSGASYTLTVIDENGDIVWQPSTDETSLTLMPRRAEVVLTSGQVYYWYVDALLGGGESVTTRVHEFRAIGRSDE